MSCPPGTGGVEVTVAVKVTDWFKKDGLSEDVIAVVVLAVKLFSNTLTLPTLQLSRAVQLFATSRSGLPSAFTSTIATELGCQPPGLYLTGVWKVPSPLPRSTWSAGGTVAFATTTSGLPSPFTSPIATDVS